MNFSKVYACMCRIGRALVVFQYSRICVAVSRSVVIMSSLVVVRRQKNVAVEALLSDVPLSSDGEEDDPMTW